MDQVRLRCLRLLRASCCSPIAALVFDCDASGRLSRVRIDGLESLQSVQPPIGLYGEPWVQFPNEWNFNMYTPPSPSRINLKALELVNMRSTVWRPLLSMRLVESVLIENCTFGNDEFSLIYEKDLAPHAAITIKDSSIPDLVVASGNYVPLWSECTIIDSLVGCPLSTHLSSICTLINVTCSDNTGLNNAMLDPIPVFKSRLELKNIFCRKQRQMVLIRNDFYDRDCQRLLQTCFCIL